MEIPGFRLPVRPDILNIGENNSEPYKINKIKKISRIEDKKKKEKKQSGKKIFNASGGINIAV